mgnify:CR=1 FL=1
MNLKLKILVDNGQTLIEAVVVIAVGIIVVAALVFATIASLRNSGTAKNQAQATKLAQEGLEIVRTSRDRDGAINNLSGVNYCWAASCSGMTPIWSARLSQDICIPAPSVCYFKITSGDLISLSITGASLPPPSGGETIGNFTRYVILDDDALNYPNWKTVTALVTWSDFAGTHESRVSTFLRKL